MSILFARHGQTEWNIQNRLCGRADIPLTDEGRKQAVLLAENLRGEKLDLIISSPLRRAAETGRAVAELCGAPLITDQRLIEMDFGIYDGADFRDPGFESCKVQFALGFPGGETWLQVAARVYSLIEEVKIKYAGQNVLLLGHGYVGRIVHTYSHKMTNEDFFGFLMPNAVFERIGP